MKKVKFYYIYILPYWKKTINWLTNKKPANRRGFLIGGPSGNRTHMPFEHDILSVTCIPVPPSDHFNLFFYFYHGEWILNYGNLDTKLVNFPIDCRVYLHLYDPTLPGSDRQLLFAPNHILRKPVFLFSPRIISSLI